MAYCDKCDRGWHLVDGYVKYGPEQIKLIQSCPSCSLLEESKELSKNQTAEKKLLAIEQIARQCREEIKLCASDNHSKAGDFLAGDDCRLCLESDRDAMLKIYKLLGIS